MNEYPEQTDVVRREAQKKTRHLSLRKLIEQAPQVLTAICPCWMASPLSVSQLLPPRRCFDVVLFDEASQISPEDAIPSIMRAKQMVVAGDPKQLPPTAFFADRSSSEVEDNVDEAMATEGFESLLDQTSSFLDTWSLKWHYRSRDERLIAFSKPPYLWR